MSLEETAPPSESPDLRLRIRLRGAVQGVGFRPFIHRLASDMGLKGWVNNSPQGVTIEVEGSGPALSEFLDRVQSEKPPRSFIQSCESSWLDLAGYASFDIRPSETGGDKTALVMPDVATCPDCLREILDPCDRRYRYPFTNCTNCGPRFSIIEALPYDRRNTSMKGFAMCAACRAEYDDPRNRRFHAQPNACPVCGPRLEAWNPAGQVLASGEQALHLALEAIRKGQIVALKGLGGFLLLANAGDASAVRLLRERKQREEKPFAVMCSSLEQALEHCLIDDIEQRLLLSPEAPIVLLRRRTSAGCSGNGGVSDQVAPGNPYLGVMLPYTPLHHMLAAGLQMPVVATSGNLSDEPICIDEREALVRLSGLSDLFLVHNRPIVRHVDDSIARVVLGRELLLRRARGYAPLPLPLPKTLRPSSHSDAILAVGAHLKNTVALTVGHDAVISQHIGDLETEPALKAFERVVGDLQRLFDAKANRIAADLHPDYLSSQFARRSGLPGTRVQHHFAHVLACMAENDLRPPVLGVAWDGSGLGLDGTIWGGEFLPVQDGGFQRFGHLRCFPLPGGERAVKEPRRAALGLLYECSGEALFDQPECVPLRAFDPAELALLRQTLPKRINAPLTSSAGRLFDAVASIIGLRQVLRFEGQAAMALEHLAEGAGPAHQYPVRLLAPADLEAQPASASAPCRADWAPLVAAILEDLKANRPVELIAARFHGWLVEVILAMAQRAGLERVALTGGCFQNKILTERTVRRLRDAGFRPYWHQRVPPNDGGIALGQAVAASLERSIE